MKYTSVRNELTANEDPAQPKGEDILMESKLQTLSWKLRKFLCHFVPVKPKKTQKTENEKFSLFMHSAEEAQLDF